MILGFLPVFTAEADSTGNDIVLRNGIVELVFSSGPDWKFKSFTSKGRELLPEGGSTAYPWALSYLGPNGETPALQPRFSYYAGGNVSETDGVPTAVFTWETVLESSRWQVNVYVSLPEDSELPEWRIGADLPEGWKVTSVEFPRIAVRRPDGAKCIMPVSYGTEYNAPSGGHIQSRYPSSTGTMQLVMMHDGNSTFYFSAKDTDACSKILRMTGEGRNLVFSQIVETSYSWSENGRFSLPWSTVLGYNDDTWENTVIKWYRPFTFTTRWGARTIGERQIAGWIKDADMWIRPSGVTRKTMDAVCESLDYYGKGIGMHWYYWHRHPFDTNYPEYFPEQEGFKDMIRTARKLGGHVTPYINGRLWDTANHTYKELDGVHASCRRADGTLYTEVYSSKVLNTVTCPSSEIWKDILYDLNRRILDSLGTDGVYMDQIGCAPSEACFSENHSHPKGAGGWWPASYRKILTDMREDLYSGRQAMTTEENVECYIDLFDMMLVVNSPHNTYTRMVPLFPVAYSDRCIYSGFTYIPWRLNDGSLNYISMKSLLWGSQLGWVNPEQLMDPANRVEARFLQPLTDFRKGNHDILGGGRFLKEFVPDGDNPVVNIPNYQDSNVVMGAEWMDIKGKKAYIAVNMSDNDRTVQMPDGRTVIVKAYGVLRVNE